MGTINVELRNDVVIGDSVITDAQKILDKVISEDSLTEVKEKTKTENYIELPSNQEVSLSDFDFRQHGFISNELWTLSLNLHARITKIQKDRITCECVIDKENRLFETRSFPALLFEHLYHKEILWPIVVSIKTRPGSTRIDIRDGKNIVDLAIFNLKDGWKKFKNLGLDKPFSGIDVSTDL